MNTIVEDSRKSQTGILWLAYGLYALLLPAVIGLLIDLFETRKYRKIVKSGNKEKAKSLELVAIHHLWLMRTFFIVLIASMVAAGTFYYGFGIAVAIGTLLWWFYRLIRGAWALKHHQAPPVWI